MHHTQGAIVSPKACTDPLVQRMDRNTRLMQINLALVVVHIVLTIVLRLA